MAGSTITGGGSSLIMDLAAYEAMRMSGILSTYLSAQLAAETGTRSYSVDIGTGSASVSPSGAGSITTGSSGIGASISGGTSSISLGTVGVTAGNVATSLTGALSSSIGSGDVTIGGNASLGLATVPAFQSGANGVTAMPRVAAASNDSHIQTAGADGADKTVYGSVDGDQIFAIGSGNVTAIAGAGRELISGAGGVVNGATVPGSTGNNSFTAGSGNDTLIAGGGNDTLTGGTGTAVMVSGTGLDTFKFLYGTVGADTIVGFKGNDTLNLANFGSSDGALTQQHGAGGTIISLADGTKITVTGVSSVAASQIKFT